MYYMGPADYNYDQTLSTMRYTCMHVCVCVCVCMSVCMYVYTYKWDASEI